jgi:hypothetical protein
MRKDVTAVYQYAISIGWEERRTTAAGGTVMVIPDRPEIPAVTIPGNPREGRALANCKAALRRGAQRADVTTRTT